MKKIIIAKLFILMYFAQVFGCFKNFNPLSYLATKSPYEAPSHTPASDMGECRAIHINHLGRHGSRYAVNNHDIDNLAPMVARAQRENALKEPLGAELVTFLDKARLANSHNLGKLTEQGRQEHRGIAERMYKNFPELFSQTPHHKIITLRNTHIQRTKDSLDAFLGRLSEFEPSLLQRTQISSTQSHECDPLLRFFDNCNAYERYVSEHSWAPQVKDAVWGAAAQRQILEFLSRIFSDEFINELGTKKQKQLAHNIYSLCQLEADVDQTKIKTGFCSFFTTDSLLEYFSWEEDAATYFSKGFAGKSGHIAHRIACPLVADFIAATDRAINDPAHAPIADLRFAHAETIMPFLVQIGLYHEDSIETMLTKPEQRKFRTAAVAPMAANVQWILYQCADNKYKIRMLHNEKNIPFAIPGCENSSSCEWSMVKNYLLSNKLACDKKTWEKDICQGVTCS